MSGGEFLENLRVSLDTLRSHKVRSGLTLLGVVIGVTSVISVAAIIDGLNSFVRERVEKLGSRTFFVTRWPFGADPTRLPEKIRLRKYLEYDYSDAIRAGAPAVEAVTAMGTRASFFGQTNDIRAGKERVERIILRGAEPEYIDALPLFTVEYGRFFTHEEERRTAHVVVIGRAIADALFPRVDPLGRSVLINGQPYEVLGVFGEDKGMFGGPGVDQFALIPLATFRKHNPQAKEVILLFSARRDVPAQQARDQVLEVLRRVRKVPHNDPEDFEVTSSDFLTDLWNQLTGAIVILTGVVSSIGLLVGGIGVMNIMLISVTERTKEIGVRKAIGARRSDIRVQFLLEAVTLTMVGGVLGIMGGAVVAWGVRTAVPSIPAALSWFWIVMGVAMSAGVGIFFGYWPANRAAALDPIVCLRYE
jgi:putative ABC transport system permease protein